MTVTRDGTLLWFLAIAALVGYLLSVGTPPNVWDYHQWLQFLAFAAAWGIGKLQVSGLPSVAEVKLNTLGTISADSRKDL